MLTLEVEPADSSEPGPHPRSVIVMTAHFRPRGLAGIGYWYSVKPLHGIVFRGMLAGLVRQAEQTPPGEEVAAHNGGERPGDIIAHVDAPAASRPDVDRTV